MNYRHAFHAGNFADLVKHAALLAVLDALTRDPSPLEVVDTHAGAGLYRLDSDLARRSGEAEAGVARLMSAEAPPAALARLAGAVRALNGGGATRLYPGSPLLAAQALRAGDRYAGFELRPDDHDELARTLRASAPRGVEAAAMLADGYTGAAARLRTSTGRTLLVIDPPFERADDYARTAELLAGRPRPTAQPALVWTPLKDLETYDAFLGRLEAAARGPIVSIECRLHPLVDPMRLNGCALVLLDAPPVEDAVFEAAQWVARTLGGEGACARRMRLGPRAT